MVLQTCELGFLQVSTQSGTNQLCRGDKLSFLVVGDGNPQAVGFALGEKLPRKGSGAVIFQTVVAEIGCICSRRQLQPNVVSSLGPVKFTFGWHVFGQNFHHRTHSILKNKMSLNEIGSKAIILITLKVSLRRCKCFCWRPNSISEVIIEDMK